MKIRARKEKAQKVEVDQEDGHCAIPVQEDSMTVATSSNFTTIGTNEEPAFSNRSFGSRAINRDSEDEEMSGDSKASDVEMESVGGKLARTPRADQFLGSSIQFEKNNKSYMVGEKRTIDSLDMKPSSSSTSSKSRRPAGPLRDFMWRNTGIHTPSIQRPKDGKDRRRRCRVCKKRKTDLTCYECQVTLCVNGYGMENCWYVYHNVEDLTKYRETQLENDENKDL